MSAFFASVIITFIVLAPPTFAAEICPSPKNSQLESATVKWVYDGDTVLLTDKRKIRIIGVDTPETKHHKQKGQAYGAKAKEALREKLKQHNYKVRLLYGKEKKDKYSRVLAHVFLKDGTNISSWLLQQGYAKTLAISPNIAFADCYKKAERSAQLKSLNIWKIKKNQIYSEHSISKKAKGYVRLKGIINNKKRYKNSLSLTLNSSDKKPIKIIIKKKNLVYFKSIDFDKLIGKSIIVSGMLKNQRKRRTIQLNHPSQLQVFAEEQIESMIKWSSK
ncbi:thermonuclease family protein [Cocleimonas sp. KMM 6892]|uniref:thermonuclease family protein n=1 Tax=unclassified Cocleimonas TaxID=2639732 RepID=UPI002DB7F431|nr:MULTISPECIES: thermonuclease family protein [unclassified Cocleimonas]MEB8432871.1 thermonuclease family protein [Cocleimonas sp. KMM 6892]MEC4715730.1 thermonuclease family protein [Cocleimonas sp. KMM 6895]MEC4744652.1 thermonuclease family protein [Cocleimonas sp. KMM 6896]